MAGRNMGVEQAIGAVAVYDIGKPLVGEETFLLACTIEELDRFMAGGGGAATWVGRYVGHTIE